MALIPVRISQRFFRVGRTKRQCYNENLIKAKITGREIPKFSAER